MDLETEAKTAEDFLTMSDSDREGLVLRVVSEIAQSGETFSPQRLLTKTVLVHGMPDTQPVFDGERVLEVSREVDRALHRLVAGGFLVPAYTVHPGQLRLIEWR